MMDVLIASDHAGFELKETLKSRASELGVTFTDLGTPSEASVDYPDYANLLSRELINRGSDSHLGILICGSGVGVSIAANRHSEIRAVLAESPGVAQLGREHNHANVLCLGSRVVSPDGAVSIIKAFLEATPDSGERHLRRISKLTDSKGPSS